MSIIIPVLHPSFPESVLSYNLPVLFYNLCVLPPCVLHPLCPRSFMTWILYDLDPQCPVSFMTWILYVPDLLGSCIHCILHPGSVVSCIFFCPASVCVLPPLDPVCPVSFVSWFQFMNFILSVLQPVCPIPFVS